jgi:hypothetical protein
MPFFRFSALGTGPRGDVGRRSGGEDDREYPVGKKIIQLSTSRNKCPSHPC